MLICDCQYTDMFKGLIGPIRFSDQGSSEFVKEKATYMFFLDFLYEIEGMLMYVMI